MVPCGAAGDRQDLAHLKHMQNSHISLTAGKVVQHKVSCKTTPWISHVVDRVSATPNTASMQHCVVVYSVILGDGTCCSAPLWETITSLEKTEFLSVGSRRMYCSSPHLKGEESVVGIIVSWELSMHCQLNSQGFQYNYQVYNGTCQ